MDWRISLEAESRENRAYTRRLPSHGESNLLTSLNLPVSVLLAIFVLPQDNERGYYCFENWDCVSWLYMRRPFWSFRQVLMPVIFLKCRFGQGTIRFFLVYAGISLNICFFPSRSLCRPTQIGFRVLCFGALRRCRRLEQSIQIIFTRVRSNSATGTCNEVQVQILLPVALPIMISWIMICYKGPNPRATWSSGNCSSLMELLSYTASFFQHVNLYVYI